ncbi:uncharacterized protein LOC116246709 isoform X1 [Nymphaea colorata]|nr:uncharacterized protein LOC116246709 isoform X1 [Nymphaea colorata]XP_049932258.1 uncharacterized protein LOC116246709 isoform X1 [Nymphaea colorata]
MSAVCISKTGDLPLINLLRFKGKPIFDQLILEEKLLRRSSDNWCIVNDGTDRPTIVSGLSGKLSQLIEVEKVMNEGIPVIRRFSGGGTVIVDNGTIFVTFICNKGAIDQLQPFPQPIMSWTGQFYSQVLGGAHKFNLRENDYCFGDHKFGGNAQSITKSRWVHHTSFLWDFDTHNMSYLTYPLKTPKYRLERNHIDFLCPMRSILLSRSEFIRKTISVLENHFCVKPMELDEIKTDANDTNEEHQYSTKLMTFEDLGKALAS